MTPRTARKLPPVEANAGEGWWTDADYEDAARKADGEPRPSLDDYDGTA